jgi:hypothetical protein
VPSRARASVSALRSTSASPHVLDRAELGQQVVELEDEADAAIAEGDDVTSRIAVSSAPSIAMRP